MRWSLVVILVAVTAATIGLVLRSQVPSSCTEAQGPLIVEIPGPPPPQAASIPPEVIQDWIAHKDEIHAAEGIGSAGGIAGESSPFEGPPPAGYSSWDEFAAWAVQYFDPYAPSEVQFELSGGAVGGVAEVPEVDGLAQQSGC